MMVTYRTFTRTARNFEQYANAHKFEKQTGLTREDAYQACQEFNRNRSDSQIRNGTKMEFESE